MTGINWYMFHSVPNHYGSSAKLSSSPILGQIVRLRTVSLVSLNGSKHGFRQDEHKPPDFAAATSHARERNTDESFYYDSLHWLIEMQECGVNIHIVDNTCFNIEVLQSEISNEVSRQASRESVANLY